jgi:hypothetical protein
VAYREEVDATEADRFRSEFDFYIKWVIMEIGKQGIYFGQGRVREGLMEVVGEVVSEILVTGRSSIRQTDDLKSI